MFRISNNLQTFLERVEDEIKQGAPVSSGALRSSIKTNVNASDNNIEIEFDMLEYGIYQDQGVNGTKRGFGAPFSFSKMPPSSSLDGWIVRKGIAPRNSKGQFTKRSGISFVIARSIMENGIRPKNFIEPVINRNIDKLTDIIINDMFSDFEKNINKNE